MPSLFSTYLNKYIPSDTLTVNRIFVTFFLRNISHTVLYNRFLSQFVLNEKHSDFSYITSISKQIQKANVQKIDLEFLIKLFEFVISPSDKIVNGAIYTPKPIRSIIVEKCLGRYNPEQLNYIKVCDIACGCGGFLMDVAEYIHIKTGKAFINIFKDNIYGIDIQEYSIERTKILLSLLALTYGEDCDFEFNLIQADTLDFCLESWNQNYTSFDVIVGNPPYVCSRNINKQIKNKIWLYEVAGSGHPDLYIPFFQIADKMLKDNGVLGYITMNSFIRSVNGRSLRRYFSSQRMDISIVDFRGCQMFDKRSTYTCLFFLNKGICANGVKYVVDEKGLIRMPFEFREIPYSVLNDKKGWNLNENGKTEKIEAIGTPIGKYCQSRHGIATLSNKTYIFRPVSEDTLYYHIEKDGLSFVIEKGICRDVVNSNKLNSNVDFVSIIEKVIYPYYMNNNGRISVIEEEKMQTNFPGAYQYLKYNKNVLSLRDKGNTQNYPTWYAYGRTQSLLMPKYKLFFPKFANSPLQCVLSDDPDLLLYNGIAFVCDSKERLQIIQKIIESRLFWNYIVKNAKPYSSDYYSLSGVDIKNFGVPNFTEKDIRHLISLDSKDEINRWLIQFYE